MSREKRELAHDSFAALAKLKTIISLLKTASAAEVQSEFIPMAEQCIADMQSNLDAIFAEK